MREAPISDVVQVTNEATDGTTPGVRDFVIRVSACSMCGIDPHIVRDALSDRGQRRATEASGEQR
jgi:threonine dehydrogenase-like Zn-dependent dehydrogenase